MEIALAVAIGALAGVLAGLFGVGGGILFVPTLALVLGLEQLHAQASSLLAILPTVVVAAWRHHRYGNVRWRAALALGAAGIAGVVGGGVVAKELDQVTLRRLFALLMLAVAGQVVVRAYRRR